MGLKKNRNLILFGIFGYSIRYYSFLLDFGVDASMVVLVLKDVGSFIVVVVVVCGVDFSVLLDLSKYFPKVMNLRFSWGVCGALPCGW